MSETEPAGLSLDPSIDTQRLRSAFEATRRIQIAPFLTEASANALREHLLERTDWRLALMADGKRHMEIDQASWSAMSPAQREALKKLSVPSGRTGFRYMFEQIVAVGDDAVKREPDTLLGGFAEFLLSPPVVRLLREITGDDEIAFADARATRYAPEHFLTKHHDRLDGSRRRAAYVFGLTPEWRPEWGGLLMFHDEREDVSFGLVPRMNVLNIFAVPQDHSVSAVCNFAPTPRYSITGWLRGLADAQA